MVKGSDDRKFRGSKNLAFRLDPLLANNAGGIIGM
jgi:hypothetical protein